MASDGVFNDMRTSLLGSSCLFGTNLSICTHGKSAIVHSFRERWTEQPGRAGTEKPRRWLPSKTSSKRDSPSPEDRDGRVESVRGVGPGWFGDAMVWMDVLVWMDRSVSNHPVGWSGSWM